MAPHRRVELPPPEFNPAIEALDPIEGHTSCRRSSRCALTTASPGRRADGGRHPPHCGQLPLPCRPARRSPSSTPIESSRRQNRIAVYRPRGPADLVKPAGGVPGGSQRGEARWRVFRKRADLTVLPQRRETPRPCSIATAIRRRRPTAMSSAFVAKAACQIEAGTRVEKGTKRGHKPGRHDSERVPGRCQCLRRR